MNSYPGLRVLLFAALAHGAPQPLFAQETQYDYYSHRGTELLRNVERYHIGPGEDKLRARQFQYAYNDFAFILNYFPNHPQGLMLMSQVCEQWKAPRCNMPQALENAVAINPNVAGTYVVQGIVLSRAKQYPAAIASLKRALEIDPQSLNAHYNLGLAYLESGKFELANEHAQKAYALGAQVPGLRERLKRTGHWRPFASTPSTDTAPSR